MRLLVNTKARPFIAGQYNFSLELISSLIVEYDVVYENCEVDNEENYLLELSTSTEYF